MSNNIHDALFKAAFSQVEHAAGELKAILPPALSARIDFSTLALEPGSFVDEHLAERHTDLLFSAKLDNTRVLLYLLYEHMSQVEPLMAFRLLAYMVRIWEAHLKERPNASRLPVIVPVVLHHSATGWTASVTFEELLDVDAETLLELGHNAVRFRFILDDISRVGDDSLKVRAMSAFSRLVLWCLKHARTPWDIVEGARSWADVVRQARAAPNGRAALETLWRYTLIASERFDPNEPPERVIARLMAALGKDEAEELVTIAELLEEKGLKRGLERGHREGRLEGRQEALLVLLGTRFGALPADVITKVRESSEAQLDDWLKRILTAPTLNDVLAVG